MKIRGKQTLSRAEQKMISQVLDRLGKSAMRSKGDDTGNKYYYNAIRIGKDMAAAGYQSANDFNIKMYRKVMENAQVRDGVDKSTTESIHTTCKELSKAIGKPNMIPKSSSDPKAMGNDDYRRTAAERINPQYWQSEQQRNENAARMEALDPRYASAADMSRYNGYRKEESLSGGEFLKVDTNGRYWTSHGCQAGEYREVTIDQIRYAFTDNRKDVMFEKNYIKGMKPGMEYTVVTHHWSKHQRPRTVPVICPKARVAAVRHQQIQRDNMALAKSMGLKPTKFRSVIHPDYDKKQGYKRFGDLLEKAGFGRSNDKSSIHADRTEFNQRMKSACDEDDNNLFTPQERSKALGHIETKALGPYGW